MGDLEDLESRGTPFTFELAGREATPEHRSGTGQSLTRLVGFRGANKYWQDRETLPYFQGCVPSGSFVSLEELGLGYTRELGMALEPPSWARAVWGRL